MDSTDEMLASQGSAPITERTAGSHGRAIALCLAACTGLVCIGYAQAALSFVGGETDAFTNSTLGYAIGALLGALLADAAGRKIAIALGCLLFSIGLWIIPATRNSTFIALARVLQGIGGGVYTFVLPIYCVEVVAKERRGLLAGYSQILLSVGYFVASHLATETSIFQPLSGDDTILYVLPQVPMVLVAIGCLFLPESPRWIYLHKGKEIAETSLKHIRGTWLVQSELDAIAAQAITISDVSGWGVFADFSILKRVAFTTVLLVIQLVFMYSAAYWLISFAAIKKPDGFAESIFGHHITLALNIINVVTAIPAVFTVDAVGRRSLLVIGVVGMIIAHTALGISISMGCDGEVDGLACNQENAVVIFISAMILILSYGACWSPVVWLYPAEVFPTNVRAKATAISSALSGVSTFWVRELFPKLQELSLVSVAVCLASVALVYVFCPETKRLLLEDTEELFAHGFHSKEKRNTESTTEITVGGHAA